MGINMHAGERPDGRTLMRARSGAGLSGGSVARSLAPSLACVWSAGRAEKKAAELEKPPVN